MALIRCSECKARISSKATSCPKCGAPVDAAKADKRKHSGCGCLLALLIAGGAIALGIAIKDMPSSPSSSQPSAQSPKPNKAKAWYSGGTLHSAKMSEWSRAPYENRLATSADFVTKLLQTDGKTIPPVDELKPLARELETAISTANKDGLANNQDVATVAATCWVLMNQ